MISKRKFGDLALTSLAANCTRCGVQHNITEPVDREGVSGSLCSHCGNILWHRSFRHIYVPWSGPTLTADEYIARTKKQERDFFATMPACPTCERHQWEKFVEDIGYPPDCRNCGKTFESGVFRSNTDKRLDEDAFWFDLD